MIEVHASYLVMSEGRLYAVGDGAYTLQPGPLTRSALHDLRDHILRQEEHKRPVVLSEPPLSLVILAITRLDPEPLELQ